MIHVNMLKEGWDVNNLYTIVPLRTAASKILREQMVGRGLRLPYGERTGDRDVDAVMLTAMINSMIFWRRRRRVILFSRLEMSLKQKRSSPKKWSIPS